MIMIKTKMVNDHFDEANENGSVSRERIMTISGCRLPRSRHCHPHTSLLRFQFSATHQTDLQMFFFLLGFFLTLNNIPVYMQWLSYVAYVRYGFEGTMMVSMFDSGKKTKNQCSIRVGACHATIKNTNRDANTGNIRVRAGEACVQPGLLPLQIPTQVS